MRDLPKPPYRKPRERTVLAEQRITRIRLYALGAILAPHPRHDPVRPGRIAADRDRRIRRSAQHLHVGQVVEREIARPAVDAYESVCRLEAGAMLALGKVLAVVPVLEFLLDARGRLHRR